jgi:hypothetical protein
MTVRLVLSVLLATAGTAALGVVDSAGAGRDWKLVLAGPGGRAAATAALGQTLRVVGTSPPAAKGMHYKLCAARPLDAPKCLTSPRYVLAGIARQPLGTWKVAPGEGRSGYFKLFLLVGGKLRAFDRVPLV